MITKTTKPVIAGNKVVGSKVTYRIFGILLYVKIIEMPEKYGIKEYSYNY